MSDTRVIEVLVPSSVHVVEVNPGVPGPAGPGASATGASNYIAKFDATGVGVVNSSLKNENQNLTIYSSDPAVAGGFVSNNTTGELASFFVGGSTSTYAGWAGLYTSAANGYAIVDSVGNHIVQIKQNLDVGVSGNLVVNKKITSAEGVGYATGAGGTVAQTTNKSTTVVLNKLCGTITMDAAALSNATTVSFTLTNSFIADADFVMVQHASGGTLGAYNFAVAPAAGSAVISVRNVHTGSLSEAVVIRFAVIKAVTA